MDYVRDGDMYTGPLFGLFKSTLALYFTISDMVHYAKKFFKESHSGFLEHWNSKKVFVTFDNVFHVYLMRGFQKYARNWILTMAFWATCKIAQPIQPIWQHIFALPWSALKKPPWEFNFFHIFGIPSSSRHEKRCQMLQTLFFLFQCSKNPRC